MSNAAVRYGIRVPTWFAMNGRGFDPRTQLSLYLPSDCWLQEYECFDMLYSVRCVQGAAWKDTPRITARSQGGQFLAGLVVMPDNDSATQAAHVRVSRYQALPPCTERVA